MIACWDDEMPFILSSASDDVAVPVDSHTLHYLMRPFFCDLSGRFRFHFVTVDHMHCPFFGVSTAIYIHGASRTVVSSREEEVIAVMMMCVTWILMGSI